MIRSPLALFTDPALAFVVKLTLVFLLGALLAALLRHRSAAARHFVWTLTLGGALALALLAPIAPRLELPVTTAETAAPAPAASVPERDVPTGAAPEVKTTLSAVTASAAPETRAAWAPSPLLLLWLAGFGSVLLWCAIGHWGLVRLARRAALVDDGSWLALLDEAAALAGVARPVRLLRSAAVGAPMTWGFIRPVVMLPADAGEWSAERRRAVVLHELAHVARLDCLVQLAATAACALYWFHPAAWMAARRLRNESERACDDQALACGTPAADYASHLLGVACKARAPRLIGAAAIGMAQRSTLEARLLSVLDETVPRRAMSARARAASAILLALALALLAAVTPVTRAVASERTSAEPAVERSVDAAPGEQLDLDLDTGAEVQIQGWDEPRVHVRAWLGGRDAADARVTVEREESGVKVRSFFAQRRNSQSTSNKLEIRVPRRFDLRLASAGGDLTMKDVEGTFRGSTGGGELVLERLSGEARLSTGGGDIRVADCDLKGSVSTGGGAVLLSRVRGGLRGSSGSGPVLYGERAGGSDEETADLGSLDIDRSRIRIRSNELTGVLHVEKAGGDVDLEEAPEGAVIHTGGGRVSVGRSAGLVDASTGGGDIEIGPAAGSVRAGTGAGDIHVTLADAGGERQTVDLTSGSGKMIVELPAGFDGAIELETAYTESH
ncbi:MAG TPA: M56 family metallopeptidase, partial [Solirubrobacterales bacterium]